MHKPQFDGTRGMWVDRITKTFRSLVASFYSVITVIAGSAGDLGTPVGAASGNQRGWGCKGDDHDMDQIASVRVHPAISQPGASLSIVLQVRDIDAASRFYQQLGFGNRRFRGQMAS